MCSRKLSELHTLEFTPNYDFTYLIENLYAIMSSLLGSSSQIFLCREAEPRIDNTWMNMLESTIINGKSDQLAVDKGVGMSHPLFSSLFW